MIQACDATNVEIEAISREIVRTASMVTKGPQVQEEVVEEDITLKIEIEIVLMTEMTEGLTIVVTEKACLNEFRLKISKVIMLKIRISKKRKI